MSGTGIIVIGMDKVISDLKIDKGRAVFAINRAITTATVNTQPDAKRLAPVDTGNLRSSIQAELRAGEGTVTAEAEYSAYVEYGTRRNRPQPYMIPAFNRRGPELLNEIAQAIRILAQ